MTRDAASTAQVRAADPTRSTWVSANAGSGKTRVLTDRVARMLMAGTDPARILCLTYTKAAAAEMQNRLFRRLGEWAMQPAEKLRASLAELGVEGPIDDASLSRARRLFAQAIETPGGLRILTIHAFCAALLRRFPLEAGVSPAFTEMDDRAGLLLRADIVDDLAETFAPQAVAEVAALYTGEDFAGLADEIAARRADFAPPLTPADARAMFGVPEGETEAAIVSDTLGPDAGDVLTSLIAALHGGSTNDVKAAEALAAFDPAAPDLSILEAAFLFGATAKLPFAAKIDSFPTKDTRQRLGPLKPALDALMLRVETARTRRLALQAARRTAALHAFAAVFLPEYARRKAERGLLDFDDLILRARALLTDPSVAQWVLYRLDGGIDHILVDEAQDTSPTQWQVIEALAAEFTAGSGARPRERTLFVVGDRKQSIYSFQGADLATFAAKRDAFAKRLEAMGTPMLQTELEHSFRSSPTILRLVDAVFDGRNGFDASRHIAFHGEMPGRVDLWPPFEKAKDPEPGDWFDPLDLPTEEHHATRLGNAVAARIKAMLDTGERIPLRDGTSKPVTAGDILILVRRRSEIFASIIRACKAAGLPIAGADRLKLGAELAVKDIAAVLSFLALPEDDLSLAAALRSPLFGWTEGQLYSLAHARPATLWQRLRDGESEALAILNDLRGQSEFLRPYDLIERLLTRHGGRARLIARLGAEAEDGIDEMLAQALAYESQSVPSLTGFLVWLDADEVEVKRQLDQGGGRIRVMTVHGAKGLEAPVVILPDTAKYTRRERDETLRTEGGPIWKTPATASPQAITDARAARRAAEEAESQRLLYVALTRAQSWLIVAAAGDLGKARDPEDEDAAPPPWFTAIAERMSRIGAKAAEGGLTLTDPHWPPLEPTEPTETKPPEPLPDWALRDPGEPAFPPGPLSPSLLGGAKALPGEDGLDTAAALDRGSRLHRLLEILPEHPRADWLALADGDLLAEAAAVLTDPALAPLFGPGTLAEVAIAGTWRGRAMLGSIDRLVIGPDRILAIDFKSNRVLPPTPEAVPEGILRQMGAYAHMLGALYPGRPIETAILWTRAPLLMPLPHALVIRALDSVTSP